MSFVALVIPADETEPLRRELVEDTRSLERLQQLVGGFIEALYLHDRITGYVNECGKFECVDADGEPIVNPRATRLMAARLGDGDFIAGDMVLCGFDATTGDHHDCPEGLEDAIT